MLPIALLLFLPVATAGRDPFQPLIGQACHSSQPEWQLRGIIGHAEDYRAWLVSAGGKGALKRPSEKLDEQWLLLNIDPLSITLAATDCGPSLKMALKGSIYEKTLRKDVPPASAAVVARQPAAALAGF